MNRPLPIERNGSLLVLLHGALLAAAVIALWVGASRTLDRVNVDGVPAPGTRNHAAATRL